MNEFRKNDRVTPNLEAGFYKRHLRPAKWVGRQGTVLRDPKPDEEHVVVKWDEIRLPADLHRTLLLKVTPPDE